MSINSSNQLRLTLAWNRTFEYPEMRNMIFKAATGQEFRLPHQRMIKKGEGIIHRTGAVFLKAMHYMLSFSSTYRSHYIQSAMKVITRYEKAEELQKKHIQEGRRHLDKAIENLNTVMNKSFGFLFEPEESLEELEAQQKSQNETNTKENTWWNTFFHPVEVATRFATKCDIALKINQKKRAIEITKANEKLSTLLEPNLSIEKIGAGLTIVKFMEAWHPRVQHKNRLKEELRSRQAKLLQATKRLDTILKGESNSEEIAKWIKQFKELQIQLTMNIEDPIKAEAKKFGKRWVAARTIQKAFRTSRIPNRLNKLAAQNRHEDYLKIEKLNAIMRKRVNAALPHRA